jgi:hypothetical protein
MAELSVMTVPGPEYQPFWSKGHLISSPARPGSKSDAMDANTLAQGTNLLEILRVLQQIDAKIEGQSKRLETLETMSPSSSAGSNLQGSSVISRGQSTRTTVSHGSVEDVDDYARSIAKMKWDALSFVRSETQDAAVNPSADVTLDDTDAVNDDSGTLGKPVPCPRDMDLYSVSIYTGDLMGSRMDLHQPNSGAVTPALRIAPPPQPPPVADETDMEIAPVEEEITSIRYSDLPATPIETEAASQAGQQNEIRTRVEETPKNRSHWKAELSFHAYDNWKDGVFAKIRNDSRADWGAEKQRFAVLRQSYRSQYLLQRVFDQMRSAFEKEWMEEKERIKALQPESGERRRKFGWKVVFHLFVGRGRHLA